MVTVVAMRSLSQCEGGREEQTATWSHDTKPCYLFSSGGVPVTSPMLYDLFEVDIITHS